jgi:hypothetical protein
MSEKEYTTGELRFRQIAATAVVIPPWGETGEHQVKETLYGLGEDGRVYMLTEHGWAGVTMHRTERQE